MGGGRGFRKTALDQQKPSPFCAMASEGAAAAFAKTSNHLSLFGIEKSDNQF